MGIVVTVGMLLGMLELNFRFEAARLWIACLLIGLGAWNALWYGLRHVTEFWGIAAMVSGLFMLLAAWQVFSAAGESDTKKGAAHYIVLTGLSACFLLYAVTIVRLNLGLPIIR